MRIAEFQNLDEDIIGEAIHDVVEMMKVDSPGTDHARIVYPGSATHRLFVMLGQRAVARAEEYGDEAGFAHGLMMAFRIGAAYGRRVPAPE